VRFETSDKYSTVFFDKTVVNPEQVGSNVEDTDVMIVGSKVSPRKRRALSDSDSGKPSVSVFAMVSR
jgi:hypothetical protein